MPLSKVGAVLHPRRFGALRSLAVYHNSKGYFLLLGGSKHPLHGSTRWVTRHGLQMRGTSPLSAQPQEDGDSQWSDYNEGHWNGDGEATSLADLEAEQLRMAIDASLVELSSEPQSNVPDARPDLPAAPASPPADEEITRSCVICMTNTPTYVLRPCRHLALCSTCAPRVRRGRLPCPVCRARVTRIERIYT